MQHAVLLTSKQSHNETYGTDVRACPTQQSLKRPANLLRIALDSMIRRLRNPAILSKTTRRHLSIILARSCCPPLQPEGLPTIAIHIHTQDSQR